MPGGPAAAASAEGKEFSLKEDLDWRLSKKAQAALTGNGAAALAAEIFRSSRKAEPAQQEPRSSPVLRSSLGRR